MQTLALTGFCAVSWAAGTALVAAPVGASTCIPFGSTCAPDDFSGQANGTILESGSTPFATSALHGTYSATVYQESDMTLDFYIQVALASDSTDGITDIVASGFQHAQADMGYRTDGSSLGGVLVSGTVVPTSVTRGPSGDSIDWDVVGLNPGDTSTVLEVHTNATQVKGNVVEITNGGNTVEEGGFAPALTPISSAAAPTAAQVGATLQDSATLAASQTLDGSGSIAFNLYAPGDTSCATPIHTETVSDITSDGPWNTTTGFVADTPGTYQWVASFSGDVLNGSGSTACGDEPVGVTEPALVPQITAASTTCRQFSAGTAPSVSSALYSTAHGKIKAVTPSGFSYFTPITSTGGTQTFTVVQLSDELTRPLLLGTDSRVLTSGCRIIAGAVHQSGATVTVTFNGGTAGETFYIDLKFKTKHVDGEPVPSPNTTVRYLFNSGAGEPELDLVP